MNPFLMQAIYHLMRGQQGMQGVNNMPYVYGGYTGQQANAAPMYQPAAPAATAAAAAPAGNQDPYHVARQYGGGPPVGAQGNPLLQSPMGQQGGAQGNPLFAPAQGQAPQNVAGLLSVAPQSPWFRQAR